MVCRCVRQPSCATYHHTSLSLGYVQFYRLKAAGDLRSQRAPCHVFAENSLSFRVICEAPKFTYPSRPLALSPPRLPLQFSSSPPGLSPHFPLPIFSSSSSVPPVAPRPHGNSSDVVNPQPIEALQGVRITQIACGDSHCLSVTATGQVGGRSDAASAPRTKRFRCQTTGSSFAFVQEENE
ncbi:hypothetical protein ABZP36_011858 [Zizania latifolia]